MDREVQVGKIYRHFKGNYYRVILIAKHTETGEKMVVYQALYSNDNTNYGYFARPYDMFISEVDHEKYPDVKQKYRLELADDNAPEEVKALAEYFAKHSL